MDNVPVGNAVIRQLLKLKLMKIKNETDSLNDLIVFMEQKRAYELDLLKQQWDEITESIHPMSIMKNLVHDVAESDEIKNKMVDSIMGFSTDFIIKKLLTANSQNFIVNLMAPAIQSGVTNLVSIHSDRLKLMVTNLLNRFLKINIAETREKL